jgi:hypothetical protein
MDLKNALCYEVELCHSSVEGIQDLMMKRNTLLRVYKLIRATHNNQCEKL